MNINLLIEKLQQLRAQHGDCTPVHIAVKGDTHEVSKVRALCGWKSEEDVVEIVVD